MSDETFRPSTGDFVIACDGGYSYCQQKGINADLVVGDFDSLGCAPEHPNVIVLKPEKDETEGTKNLSFMEEPEVGFRTPWQIFSYFRTWHQKAAMVY